jgi:hypothetical protein
MKPEERIYTAISCKVLAREEPEQYGIYENGKLAILREHKELA